MAPAATACKNCVAARTKCSGYPCDECKAKGRVCEERQRVRQKGFEEPEKSDGVRLEVEVPKKRKAEIDLKGRYAEREKEREEELGEKMKTEIAELKKSVDNLKSEKADLEIDVLKLLEKVTGALVKAVDTMEPTGDKNRKAVGILAEMLEEVNSFEKGMMEKEGLVLEEGGECLEPVRKF